MTANRYSFVCNNGCGVCVPKVVPFEYSRTETLAGELLESKVRPKVVSACCGQEVAVYDNAADNWIDGEVVFKAAAPSQSEGAEDEPDAADEWRRLALQFDGHRIQALWHLKALLVEPEKHLHAAARFIAAPPLSGEQVLADRIAALAGAAAPDEGEAWQPIESVPGTIEPVLLWTRAGKVRIETGWYAKNLLEESKEDDFECAFTHWRPPLAGPKGEATTPSSQGGQP